MSKFNRNLYDKTYKILPDDNDIEEHPEAIPSTSVPVHVQRAERALNLSYFLRTMHNMNLSSDSEDSDDLPDISNINTEALIKDFEPMATKDYYNFKSVSANRKWLADVLQENSDNVPDDVPYKNIAGLYNYQKQVRRNKKVNFDHSMYYGGGLVSNIDLYPEIEKMLPAKVAKKKPKEESSKSPLYPPEILEDIHEESCLDLTLENGFDFPIEEDDLKSTFLMPAAIPPTTITAVPIPPPIPPITTKGSSKKSKKFKDEEARKKWEDLMTVKRRKLYTAIAKKEIGKQHRSKTNKHKEMLIQCKRVAQQCVKYGRQKALQSARTVKEQIWRMKRLSRENIAYWKRSRRFDREIKKRMEKEAEEQRKIDHELIEAKRQQRKLNFLITQTELYAHFMSRKLGQASPEEQLRILSQLDEDKGLKLAIDDYDSETMKEKAKRNAQEAFQNEKARTRHFDMEASASIIDDDINGEQPQPSIFRGKLKGYQLRGMNWLANLYAQGISGILADEMGLGKTVQSIAFLCHIAEKYSVWGPFLIISPASTLHNWQQEIAKFVPDFKVVPYWGNPTERRILRQFWDQKDIYTKDASFHIVITSYQIVITDIKYFNRIKWQYMILDEAQAIKSTSSMRWKTLLGFSCRNRLLLSGTPIQNSMAELWALLHFIMPTLFDSHEEFNEWFSKDIESHAENKTGIDEKHLSRLHMILKPFMLRRIKKDVENELSDKIEVMVYCPLTTRQNLLYLALKQKIKIEDLLHYTVGGGGDSHTVDKNFTSNLMNLVMQFRKVCNHPELFERRDAKSPIRFTPPTYSIPYLVYDSNVRKELFLKLFKYFLFSTEYVNNALKTDPQSSLFRFCRAANLSVQEFCDIMQGNITARWKHYYDTEKSDYVASLKQFWQPELFNNKPPLIRMAHESKLNTSQIENSPILSDLVFVRKNTGRRVVYAHKDHYYHSMPETVEHKNIRLKNVEEEPIIDVVNEDIKPLSGMGLTNSTDFPYIERPTKVFKCQKTELPSFLFSNMPKVSTSPISLYCYSRRAAWDLSRFIDDFNYNSVNRYWSLSTGNQYGYKPAQKIHPEHLTSALDIIRPVHGWSNITIPDKETLVTDSGKLSVLDGLLKRLKEGGHRVLIYSQMTKMIDLLEEYMWHRHHKYMRLDGSSKISERRDMVADFQARTDIFVFLLSTRAGGLGINLTAADTVIFYDSDWNPTVDQQAMDRAHRLGQTKQVTVYRLICKGSIEERILQRAREKSEIQKLVISGGNFKPDTLKPKEVVSLLLDDDELVQKYHLKVEGGKTDEAKEDRKRKHPAASSSSSSISSAAPATATPTTTASTAPTPLPFKTIPAVPEPKRLKSEQSADSAFDEQWGSGNLDSAPNSPRSVNSPDILADDNENNYTDEGDSPISNKYTVYNVYGSAVKPRTPGRGSSRRGRPRGSRTRALNVNRFGSNATTSSSSEIVVSETSSAASSTRSSPVSSAMFADATAASSQAGHQVSPSVRRGPGRPRLKPGGPSNAGSRGTYRPRKPTKPLPVPLPSDGAASGSANSNNSNQYTSYSFYDFPEQTDS